MSSADPPVELSPDLLLRAYAAGLFPMAESADDPTLFWVDPQWRGIFPLEAMRMSRSLAKVIRSDRFAVAADRDFEAVIEACAEASAVRPNTWINATIRDVYGQLFRLGYVHTIEVRREDRLVGGLYGVALGGAFFGESMFHRETDASKVALIHLAARLVADGYVLLDTQFVTPHLASLGAVEVPRKDYRVRLARALRRPAGFRAGLTLNGQEALAILREAQAQASGDRTAHLPAGSLPGNSFE